MTENPNVEEEPTALERLYRPRRWLYLGTNMLDDERQPRARYMHSASAAACLENYFTQLNNELRDDLVLTDVDIVAIIQEDPDNAPGAIISAVARGQLDDVVARVVYTGNVQGEGEMILVANLRGETTKFYWKRI